MDDTDEYVASCNHHSFACEKLLEGLFEVYFHSIIILFLQFFLKTRRLLKAPL